MKQVQELDIRDYLQRFHGDECDLLRFPGNYGDALIWHGTQHILSHVGLNFRTIDCTTKPTRRMLIIDGGGNLVDLYSDVEKFLDFHGQSYSKVIVLPHTITGVGPLACLGRLGGRLTVFCRERISYMGVRASLPRAEVYLWHDCAFYVPTYPTIQSEGWRTDTLHAFRTDVESISRQLPNGNRDLSLEGYAMSSLDLMFRVLQGYKQVVTDRLHIAIASALLGCEVDLHPNSYYKNWAVYDYSLRRYTNVHFSTKS
ncbi:hypothetical protein GSUET_14650 [Geobacter sulfurreducens subsp. ethanolicus]|uniref:polysaccharide pyruvyl transferase family protein n=1 Tax=Geobacter sulfurreducens TaxID=35554 RepID=UPI0033057A76|nr:hypothetical protein GSUET_14650 [Geobacter sulfurreducens subsp. ethanolicus]